jgi:hypothetical protein
MSEALIKEELISEFNLPSRAATTACRRTGQLPRHFFDVRGLAPSLQVGAQAAASSLANNAAHRKCSAERI